MADYKKCIPVVLKAEGGYCNDPQDSGGPTKYGVCLVFARDTKDYRLFDKDQDGDIDKQDIKMLTIDDATEAFHKYFWVKLGLDDEPSDKVGLVVFDIAVNHGIANAGMMVQRALNKMGNNLTVDKKIGPKTLAALHAADPDEFCDQVLKVRENFYYKIVENRPSQKVFLKGWLNRIKNLRKVLKDFED